MKIIIERIISFVSKFFGSGNTSVHVGSTINTVTGPTSNSVINQADTINIRNEKVVRSMKISETDITNLIPNISNNKIQISFQTITNPGDSEAYDFAVILQSVLCKAGWIFQAHGTQMVAPIPNGIFIEANTILKEAINLNIWLNTHKLNSQIINKISPENFIRILIGSSII